ncbi:DegT/DnrJ/EryC1/StrS family aminotransferase [Vibrio navarrensis]
MRNEVIPVTKPYLPSKDKYKQYIDLVYENGWLTNNGPLVRELEYRLAEYLGVKHVVLVANGSLALQVAYKVLNLTGEVITTPFSFAATTSTLSWEGLKPIFCDIDKKSFNIDVEKIEELITPLTSAVLPVHVFGNPCQVGKIQSIAKKNGLKVIYDAAHAFGVKYLGESVLKYGDISTLSFHATKLFHSIEGGAIITEDDELANKARLMLNFGITGPDKIEGLGTNAKMNELEAAMGLCVLDDIEIIISKRSHLWNQYKKTFSDLFQMQQWSSDSESIGAYVPIVFDSEQLLLNAKAELEANNIFPRRYFYPSLDRVESYGHKGEPCQISREISEKILCLPIYYDLCESKIDIIKTILNKWSEK